MLVLLYNILKVATVIRTVRVGAVDVVVCVAAGQCACMAEGEILLVELNDITIGQFCLTWLSLWVENERQ